MVKDIVRGLSLFTLISLISSAVGAVIGYANSDYDAAECMDLLELGLTFSYQSQCSITSWDAAYISASIGLAVGMAVTLLVTSIPSSKVET